MSDKPILKLVGEDGNAFSIMGRASQVARRHGWSKEKIDAMIAEMTSGDYDHLLQTCFKYFDVE